MLRPGGNLELRVLHHQAVIRQTDGPACGREVLAEQKRVCKFLCYREVGFIPIFGLLGKQLTSFAALL